ncbi:MAG: chorismate mutase [Clostridia bacterium]|nr:chorismate mutase [Clostridia bacterium]
MKNIEDARKEISEIDREIASLFVRRMKAVKEVAEYKKERGLPIFDAAQEERVIARNEGYIDDDSLKGYYLTFLQNTMEVSKQYQHRLTEGAKVAYSGVEGAFAHIAAKHIFPDAALISYPSFELAYAAVESGECDLAVLPTENSYAGEVGQVFDLIFNGKLHINGLYNLHITQNLLGVKGAKLEDIKTVISHPQALEQCAPYIKSHGFKSENAENTARAAKAVLDKNDKSVAAIASVGAAKLYGLELIDHDINESKLNTTRFAVFSKTESARESSREGSTFLLFFTVNHVAGALAKAINVIGEHGFNMKALRSRPMKSLPFQYYFYVEAEGDENSENGKKMLKELSKHCEMLKIAGRYSAASSFDIEEEM